MYHDVVPENSLKFDQDLFKNHPTHGAVVPLAMFVSQGSPYIISGASILCVPKPHPGSNPPPPPTHTHTHTTTMKEMPI